jgi:hypothetical protein
VVGAAVVSAAGAVVGVATVAVTAAVVVVDVLSSSPSSPPHALANTAASAHTTTAAVRGVLLTAHPQASRAWPNTRAQTSRRWREVDGRVTEMARRGSVRNLN